MPTRKILASGGIAVVVLAIGGLLPAHAQGPLALTGQVASVEEGPMEGVLVSAKKNGSAVTITVVSDTQGNYSFPAAKLQPGQYSLQIRAIGRMNARHHMVFIVRALQNPRRGRFRTKNGLAELAALLTKSQIVKLAKRTFKRFL